MREMLREPRLTGQSLADHLREAAQGDATGRARLTLPRGLRARLRAAAATVNGAPRDELLPAAQWLEDNARMLEEEALSLGRELRALPPLPARKGEADVLLLSRELLAHSEAQFTVQSLSEAVAGFQRARTLTERELGALPCALRLTLLALISDLSVQCAAAQRACESAADWARGLPEGRLDAARMPRGGAFLERLISILRENEDVETLAFLDERLRAEGVRPEKLVDEELSRRTLDCLWMGNAVSSLRALSHVEWQRVLEEFSRVDAILRADATYPRMDDESRAYYRRAVSRIARRSRRGEEETARAAIDCAAGQRGLLAHVGYYLADEGLPRLCRALGGRGGGALFLRAHARGVYLGALYGGAAAFAALAALLGLPVPVWLLFALVGSACTRALSRRLLRRLPPRMLPRMKVAHLSGDLRTLVVCPTLLTSASQALRMASHLSTLRLANPDRRLDFMLLADFADSRTRALPADAETLRAGREAFDALNEAYGGGFYYLHRERAFQAADRLYMGRERKRGALETLNALLLGEEPGDTFRYASCPAEELAGRYAYVITLDADTMLPPGSALRLVGAMLHPLQKGRVNVIQPRMEVAAGSVKTWAAWLLGGRGGVDPYNAAVSEVYQDVFGAGSFQGKGIYAPAAFAGKTRGRIAPNTVLSHDLLEGELAGSALANDIVLYDGHPQTLAGWLKRLERWTRGDWQLAPYLLNRELSLLSRHKLWDNLRRSLVPAARVALLGYAVAAGSWVSLAAALALPFPRPLEWLLLPALAWTQLSGAARALFRRLVSKRRLLQWVTAAQGDGGGYGALLLCAPILGAAMFACALPGGALHLPGLLLAAAWMALPLAAPLLDGARFAAPPLSETTRGQMEDVARRTWRFFEESVTARGHFLPPDNVQLDPDRGAAMRTSPTNIGLYLLSCCAACELGLIEPDEMARRMSGTVETLETLPKWEGHLYNWYDIQTLAPLPPAYVSSVDSGNLLACLLACAQYARRKAASVDASLRALPARLDALAGGMRLNALYDARSELFCVGYDVQRGVMSSARYDLLASEARLLSFAAVMTGQAPVRHWYRLSRAMTRTKGGAAPVSWGGTMFEYLMPNLLLPLTRGTLLGEGCRHAVREQMRLGKRRPWGVSESGYYAFDPSLNYQYKAFGLPALSLGGEGEDCVTAPYASALAAPLFPEAVGANFTRMREKGMEDEHGFFEAADYSPARTQGETPKIVRSHMAHHQGMILCALCNALRGGALARCFAELPEARAFALLLEEKMPRRTPRARTLRLSRPSAPQPPAMRRAGRAGFPVDAHLMHAGGATLMVTAQGQGYIAVNGVMLTRFRDRAGAQSGMQFYLRDSESGEMTRLSDGASAVFETGLARFSREALGLRAHLTCFVSPLDGAAVHLLEIANLRDAPRLLECASYAALSLSGQAADEAHPAFRNLFVQTGRLSQSALTAKRRPRDQGDTEKTLVHALSAGEPLSHVLLQSDRAAFLGRGGSVRAPEEMRRSMRQARPLVGAPIEPCMSVRAQFQLAGGARLHLCFVTALCEDEGAAEALLSRYARPEQALRAMQLAVTQAHVTARYLSLDARMLSLYGRMAGCLLYGAQPFQHAGGARRGREGLWSLGISGDLPILLVSAASPEELTVARHALRAHALFRMQGFWVDLVLLNTQSADYDRPVHDALRDMAALGHTRDTLGAPGGIHLLDAQSVPAEALGALRASARLTLSGARPLSEQLKALAFPETPPAKRARVSNAPLPALARSFFNGLGGFPEQEDAYVIDLSPGQRAPAPWCNLLCNADFGTIAGEGGPVFSYARNSYHGRLTEYRNDAVLTGGGETLLVRDEDTGEVFSITPDPAAAAPVRVTHMPGATRYESRRGALALSLTLATDPQLPLGLRVLKIVNEGDKTRRLRVLLSVDFQLGPRAQDAQFVTLCAEDARVTAASPQWEDFAYLAHIGRGEAAARTLPAGLLRTLSGELGDPAALPGMAGTAGLVSVAAALSPREGRTVAFALGVARTREEMLGALDTLRERGASARIRETRASWAARLGKLRVFCPDEALSRMLNVWLPYQVRAARLQARAGFYQAGGAIGYRDQLQDMLALLFTEPETVRAHLLECAAHQFVEGDVQHWWHPPRLGVRTRISDDLLFLPYVTAYYVRVTGDTRVLDEEAPYLEGPAVPEGQEDWYGEPRVSGLCEPLREHCLRAIRRVRLGAHGLPLMGGGDWNDGMNHVGGKQGESVWLGWFLLCVLADFAPLCGEDARRELGEMAGRLRASMDAAWDGAWYIRAWYDGGAKLGAGDTGRIDAISQSFAVLAGAPRDKARTAVRSAMARLFDGQHGLLKLLDPPFDGTRERPGYIAGYLPGIRENGGQYTHAVPWMIRALVQLGETSAAWQVLHALLPVAHAATPEGAARYRVEPYVMAADVYANEQQLGRGGWTWYTGSAAWTYLVTLCDLLGFEKRGDRVRLTPRLPGDWEGFTIMYRFGGATYYLHAARDALFATLDGVRSEDGWIDLRDDNKTHEARFPHG